jgi:hypothetical protein
LLKSYGSTQYHLAMRYRFLMLFLILCISCGCKEKDRIATITGKVTDAVSGKPVEGALVSLSIRYSYEDERYNISVTGASCLSGTDGMYILNYKYNKDEPVYFKETAFPYRVMNFTFPEYYVVYATKTDFITSDYHTLSDSTVNNTDIKMYHGAQLNVHVKNEGINHLDGVRVCVDRGSGFTINGTPEFIFKCSGTDFDSTFVLKDLWGGFYYTCEVIPLTGPTYKPVPYVYKFSLLLPDTINHLFVSY